jgi:hypothetical protein
MSAEGSPGVRGGLESGARAGLKREDQGELVQFSKNNAGKKNIKLVLGAPRMNLEPMDGDVS